MTDCVLMRGFVFVRTPRLLDEPRGRSSGVSQLLHSTRWGQILGRLSMKHGVETAYGALVRGPLHNMSECRITAPLSPA